MAARAENRFAEAGALAAEVAAWLDGDLKRNQATNLVAQAEAIMPEVTQLRANIMRLRQQAGAIIDAMPPRGPLEEKEKA